MNTDIDWPEDASEEARAMGELLAVFRSGAAKFAVYLTVGVLALVLAAGAAVLLWMVFEDAAPNQQLHGVGKLGVLAVFMAGAGLATLRKAFTARDLSVYVCTKGLARQQREKVEGMRWDEVNKVVRRNNPKSQEFSISSPAQLVLTADDGREWVFDEAVPRLQELRQIVEEHTLPWMLPPAREAFRSGETIGFGEVRIDDRGLHFGSKTTSWEEFENAEAEKGRLSVYGKGRRKPLWRAELAKVPSVHVLLALAEHARSRHGERGV